MTPSQNGTEWTRRYDPERQLFAIRRLNRDEHTGVLFTEYLHGGKRLTQEDAWRLADDVARLFAELSGEAPRLYFPKFGELHIDGRLNLRMNAKVKKQIRRLGLDPKQIKHRMGERKTCKQFLTNVANLVGFEYPTHALPSSVVASQLDAKRG